MGQSYGSAGVSQNGSPAGIAGVTTPTVTAGGGAPGGVLRTHLLAATRNSAPVTAGRPPPLPATAPTNIERAMASAAGRAASRANGLAAIATAVTPTGVSLAELPELLPEGALIAVIEGPGERLGVVALCPAMVASLIEMQAVGRVSTRAVPLRRSTRTDAAIAAEFVNLLLAEAAISLGPLPLAGAIGGFRYASYLDEPRPLGLMLDDTGFHGISLGLRLGTGGERNGTVAIFVPGLPQVAPPAPALPDPAPATTTAPRPTRPNLADAVRQAPVPLIAVLCRKTVTLRELRGLVPGATLSLPRNAMEQVGLETEAGQPLVAGRLGEAEGYYALRLQNAGPLTPAAEGLIGGMPSTPFMPAMSGLNEMAEMNEMAGDAGSFPITEPPMADLSAPDMFRMGDAMMTSASAAEVLPNAPSHNDMDTAPLPMSFVIN